MCLKGNYGARVRPCESCGTGDFDIAVAVGDSGSDITSSSAAAAAAVATAAAPVVGQAPAPVQAPAKAGIVQLALELGPSGLMLGWYERLFHVGTIVVIQLLVYDNIKQVLLNL